MKSLMFMFIVFSLLMVAGATSPKTSYFCDPVNDPYSDDCQHL